MVEATSLLGRYRLERRLATGGMGTVYAAIDERLNRKVAVKLLKDQLADDPRFVERFRREARAVAALSHPNIAGIFDYGEDGGKHFIVMEYIEGRDLARIIREETSLATERAARIGAQICAALGQAHGMEIVHRDIKPGNVIVGPGDHVKVTDFGIARAAGESTLTATGSMLGTAQYLSPEQASGGRVGPPSDIYSAGIVLYEMLTGSVPFTGESAVSVAMRHVSDDIPAPSTIKPDVPAELDDIVAAATAKDPDDRWASALAMADALKEMTRDTEPAAPGSGAVAGTAVLEPHPATSPMGPAATTPAPAVWTPQRIGRAVALALGALLLLLGVILVVNLIRDEDPASTRRGDRAGAGARTESEETPADSPASYTIEEFLIGIPYTEAKDYLEKDEDLADFEFVVAEEKLESEEEKDIVIDIEPPPGTQVGPGSTITLLVSEGDQGEGEGPPEEPPGKEKKDKEEEDDD